MSRLQQEGESSPTTTNIQQIFIPSTVSCDIPDVPPVFIKKMGNRLRITGDGLSNSDTDDLPSYNAITENIRKWYPDAYVVNMETYGGTQTEEGQNVGMDLSCLFYSCLKAISPDVQEVSMPWVSDNNHMLQRAFITHTFKKNIAEYLFTDLNQPTPEELDYVVENAVQYEGLSPEEIYTKVLENKIKTKYIAFNESARSNFFEILENTYDFTNEESKQEFINRLQSAVAERNDLITNKKILEDKAKDGQELDADEEDLLENINFNLRDPELVYNIILEEFTQLYPDPRNHIWKAASIGSFGTGSSDHYAFSHEIRQLPLTTGLFNLPIVFTSTESDFRGDEFNGSQNAPLDGKYKPETIIDQMLYRKEHGIASLDLVCQVTGFNVYCLDSRGNPHDRYSSRGSYTEDIDIVKIMLNRLIMDRWPERDESSQDPKAPCFIIKYVPGHFESIAVLHEMDVSECEVPNKKIFQAQSVFSYFDPFIVAIRRKVVKMIEEEKSSYAEEQLKKKTAAAKKTTTGITVTARGNPAQSILSRLKGKRADITQTEKFNKATLELEEEGLIDRTRMTKQQQLTFIKDIVANLGAEIGEEVSVEHYIDEKASEHDSKASTPVKKETQVENIQEQLANMTHKQRVAYWNKEFPEWKDAYKDVQNRETQEEFITRLSGLPPVWNPKTEDYEYELTSGVEQLGISKPASPKLRSASPTRTKQAGPTSPTKKPTSPTSGKGKTKTRTIKLLKDEKE